MTDENIFRMRALTVFHNARIDGGTVVTGQEFDADANYAKDLVRLGHAEALDGEALDKAKLAPEPVATPAVAANRVSSIRKVV